MKGEGSGTDCLHLGWENPAWIQSIVKLRDAPPAQTLAEIGAEREYLEQCLIGLPLAKFADRDACEGNERGIEHHVIDVIGMIEDEEDIVREFVSKEQYNYLKVTGYFRWVNIVSRHMKGDMSEPATRKFKAAWRRKFAELARQCLSVAHSEQEQGNLRLAAEAVMDAREALLTSAALNAGFLSQEAWFSERARVKESTQVARKRAAQSRWGSEKANYYKLLNHLAAKARLKNPAFNPAQVAHEICDHLAEWAEENPQAEVNASYRNVHRYLRRRQGQN